MTTEIANGEIVFGDITTAVNSFSAHLFTIGAGLSGFDYVLNKNLSLAADDPFLVKPENQYIKEHNDIQREIGSETKLQRDKECSDVEYKMSIVNSFLHLLKNVANG